MRVVFFAFRPAIEPGSAAGGCRHAGVRREQKTGTAVAIPSFVPEQGALAPCPTPSASRLYGKFYRRRTAAQLWGLRILQRDWQTGRPAHHSFTLCDSSLYQCFQVLPPSGETSVVEVWRIPSGEIVVTLRTGTVWPVLVVMVDWLVQVHPSAETVSVEISRLPSLRKAMET